MNRRLVLASDNAGKLRELRQLLLGVDVIAQGELGIEPAAEPHATFIENALAKARHAATASGLPALADDSGLCCASLGGEPGVRSARLAGEGATDADNNTVLIERLRKASNRAAHYVCVLVAVRFATDPEPLVAIGRWHGRIVDTARGTQGFGYDPHFFVDSHDCTAAELSSGEKNRISHRAAALQMLLPQLSAWV